MSYRVSGRTVRPVLVVMTLVGVGPAVSADLDYPPYAPPEPAPTRIYREERIEEPPPPRVEPRFTAAPRFAPPPAEACRTIVKRRIDEDGAEIERRVRICDERLDDGPGPAPRWRPSVYGAPHPVPPADVPDGGWADRRW